MGEMTRRSFLRRSAGAGLAIGGLRALAGCGAAPPYIPVATDTPTGTLSQVTVVRGSDLAAMMREALQGMGGMSAIVHPGETVFIKPNAGGMGFIPHNLFTSGESAKVEIIVAVAEECLKAGASKVTIGEGGQIASFPWEGAVTLDGSTNLVREAERLNSVYPDAVTLACLEVDSPAWDPIPSPHTDLGQIYVSSHLARADRVISIAPVKTHRWTYLTGTMKNFVGTTSFNTYGIGINSRTGLHFAAGGVEQCFLDIVAGVKPDLAIIDGSIGCEGNGPHVFPMWGITVDIRDRLGDWFLLAGTDPVAVDATVARIIGQDVGQVPFLQRAYEQGLGQIQEEMIDLRGAKLDELKMEWRPAVHTEGFGDVILPAIILKSLGLW